MFEDVWLFPPMEDYHHIYKKHKKNVFFSLSIIPNIIFHVRVCNVYFAQKIKPYLYSNLNSIYKPDFTTLYLSYYLCTVHAYRDKNILKTTYLTFKCFIFIILTVQFAIISSDSKVTSTYPYVSVSSFAFGQYWSHFR